MLAEEFTHKQYEPTTSIAKGTTIALIIRIIISASIHFKNAIKTPTLIKPLNENALTQILVEQIDIQIRKAELPFGVKNQYSDLFFKTKGIPDFYFHILEEGKYSPALFVVESKRLPAPASNRTKEYVIGETLKKNGIKECNGGIERFKIEMHGKGLTESGMIGFIESESFNHWQITINCWIDELSKTFLDWQLSEKLEELESEIHYSYLNSSAITSSGDKVKLHHIWINVF